MVVLLVEYPWAQIVFFIAQNTTLHALFDFKVSVEKSAIIFIGLPLYVICFFSLINFKILSLC
jgi:hypothetical protein